MIAEERSPAAMNRDRVKYTKGGEPRRTVWLAAATAIAVEIGCSSITYTADNPTTGGSNDNSGGRSNGGTTATSAPNNLGGSSNSAASATGGTESIVTTAAIGGQSGAAGTSNVPSTGGATAGNTNNGSVTGSAVGGVSNGGSGNVGTATSGPTGGVANSGGSPTGGVANSGGSPTGSVSNSGGSPTGGAPHSEAAGGSSSSMASCSNLTSGCPDCCASLAVPAGAFPMGRSVVSTDSDYFETTWTDELPEHNTSVDAFALDKYEVTVGRFRQFVNAYDRWLVAGSPMVGAGARAPNSNTGWLESWTTTGNELLPNASALRSALLCKTGYENWTNDPSTMESAPINCVTWYEAFAFCIWDGARLPTEAEWEYASAGGGGASGNRRFPWGASAPTIANDNCMRPDDGVHLAVGSVPAGVGRWGHLDLAGSMYEWALDWYSDSYYSDFSTSVTCNNCVNLTPATPAERIFRGGSYSSDCTETRSAFRNSAPPSARMSTSGMRCARAVAR
jgi:formylglycine-generating enzyme